MASNSSAPALPNPYTPLAFLPPTLADQFQASCYLYVAGLSAFAWDWLMSMPDEIKILRRSRFNLPTVAYLLSRIGTLGYCTTATVFQAAPVEHCQTLLYIIGGFFMLAVPSTSFLFLLRVRAVYGNSRAITIFFGGLWVCILGLSVLVPLAINGAHIGPTRRCINTAVRSYGSTPIILNAVNDTLIFLAISFRIVSYTLTGETWRARFKSFFYGAGLPRVSKGLLHGGQIYYFATIGLSIVTAGMVLAPSFIPPVYHAMFTIPNIALENSMACRVFRAVKLGFIKDPTEGTTVFTTTLHPEHATMESGIVMKRRATTVDDIRGGMRVAVEISQTTDRVEDPSEEYGYTKKAQLIEEEGSERFVDPSEHV